MGGSSIHQALLAKRCNDSRVCLVQEEEKRYSGYLELIKEATGLDEQGLCDLDIVLQAARYPKAHISESDKETAHVSEIKGYVGEIVNASNATVTHKLMDFLASFSTGGKLFVPDTHETIAKKVELLNKVGNGS